MGLAISGDHEQECGSERAWYLESIAQPCNAEAGPDVPRATAFPSRPCVYRHRFASHRPRSRSRICTPTSASMPASFCHPSSFVLRSSFALRSISASTGPSRLSCGPPKVRSRSPAFCSSPYRPFHRAHSATFPSSASSLRARLAFPQPCRTCVHASFVSPWVIILGRDVGWCIQPGVRRTAKQGLRQPSHFVSCCLPECAHTYIVHTSLWAAAR